MGGITQGARDGGVTHAQEARKAMRISINAHDITQSIKDAGAHYIYGLSVK